MVPSPKLTSQQNLAAATVTGTVERYSIGANRDAPIGQAVAELLQITGDPLVFGIVLAGFLVRVADDGRYGRAVAMLRAVGADEDAAAEKAAWLRERQAQRGGMTQ